jgi:hypothetical protein
LLTLRWQRTAGLAGDGEATWRKLGTVAGSEAPPTKPRAPTWVSVFGDPFRTVDLAQAVAHLRGGELNTAARVSIFAGQNSP